MAHSAPLISTLVFGLVLAFGFGLIAQRFKLPPLIGYLLAGIAIGPFTPGFVADQGVANQLAEIGVILLMFGVGCTSRSTICCRSVPSPSPAPSPRRGSDAARHGCRLVAGLDARRGTRLRHRPVGREHRGAAAPASGAPAARYRARAHHRRLAHRPGPRHGDRAGAAAGARRRAQGHRGRAGSLAARSRPSPSRSARSPPSSSSCSSSAGK